MSEPEPARLREPASALLAARRRWANFLATGCDASSVAAPVSIGIAASFTANPLAPHLGAALLDSGFAPKIALAPYNQIPAVCADPNGVLEVPPDILILLPRIEELAAVSLRKFFGGDPLGLPEGRGAAESLVAEIADLRRRFDGTLIVGSLPWPDLVEADPLALDGEASRFVRAVQGGFDDALSAVPDVVRLDVAALQRYFGARQAFDARTWYLYRQPYGEAFFAELGRLAARVVTATRRASRKCLVLDCDNTLWGGVIGEDGLGGIQLGDEFPGSAYADLQRLALLWRRQGVLLAIATKNNPDEVMEVFRRHDGMVLKESDVSIFAVSWRPKSEAVEQIAHSLNIGMDSLVLIDDSPYEIAEVREKHPEVLCIQIPSASEKIVDAVLATRAFDRLEITADDRTRADRIAVEIKREHLRTALPEAEFIARLELCVDSFPVNDAAVGRVTQLINKTNQFNLTTPRLTAEQVRSLAARDDTVLRAAKVADRFGEYGLTCVGCATAASSGTWRLDLFLMSCRVLGRGVETSFLSDIATEVLQRGGSRLAARHIATARNGVCADFLARHGFTPGVDGEWWHDAAALAANRPAGRSLPAASPASVPPSRRLKAAGSAADD